MKMLFTALPGPPSEVRPSEITATTVRLTWTYNGPEEPQYYVIQYKPKYANQVRYTTSKLVEYFYSFLFKFLFSNQNDRDSLKSNP